MGEGCSDKPRFVAWRLLVLVLAILLYSLGTTLDVIVFDPLYGLAPSGLIKRAWRFIACLIFSPIKFVVDKLPGTKEMAGYRKAATAELRGRINGSPFTCEKDEDCLGIYSSARTLLEGTPEWNDYVSPWLAMSKTIRSFVWPLTAFLAYDLVQGGVPLLWLNGLLSPRTVYWLAWWGVWLAALLLALVLYVWLRVFHMRAMFKLVKDSEYIAFPIRHACQAEYRTVIPGRYLAIGERDGQKKDKARAVFLLVAK